MIKNCSLIKACALYGDDPTATANNLGALIRKQPAKQPVSGSASPGTGSALSDGISALRSMAGDSAPAQSANPTAQQPVNQGEQDYEQWKKLPQGVRDAWHQYFQDQFNKNKDGKVFNGPNGETIIVGGIPNNPSKPGLLGGALPPVEQRQVGNLAKFVEGIKSVPKDVLKFGV